MMTNHDDVHPSLTRSPSDLAARFAPMATVFVSSACIMVIELVAGRLVSRHLGQSLYTWTSIIGVVLAGISIGNYLGGRLADRSSGRAVLAVQFLLAAAACLSVLALNALAGRFALLTHFAWPVRIFFHVTLVFLLPATVLGTISPVIAKRALAHGRSTGRTVGNVYAWATAGSIVGTFLTGFYLLMWMGVTAVATAAAAALGLIGAVYGILSLLSRERGPAEEMPASTELADAPLAFKDWLAPVSAVFVASVCVMAIEIAAGRIVSRHFGQSLYTWTTVIGVVLAGMTFGSYLGGRLADRFRADATLCALFVLASASCQLAPFLSKAVVDRTLFIAYSWPMQIALHTVVVFALPSMLLGAVTPVVVKATLMKGRGAGRIIGSLYAWGSVGSILGTFLTGFFLIAAMGTVLVLHTAAAVLASGAVVFGGAAAFKEPGSRYRSDRAITFAFLWAVVCAAALLLGAISWPQAHELSRSLALSDTPPDDAIYVCESQYSYIAVTADPKQPNVRQMVLDRLLHSRVDVDNPADLRYEYEWIYSSVLDKYYPGNQPIRALVIGGGGYTFPHYLEVTRPGSAIDVAEIDPAVTEAAHAACGLPRNTAINVHNMDAGNFVAGRFEDASHRGGYDCIFGDSVNDYSVPYHLTTREFNERVSALLADDGMYLLNLIDMLDSGQFLGAVLNTCRETFPCVYVFSAFDNPEARDTFVIVNSKRPLDLEDLSETIRKAHPYRGDQLTQEQLDALARQSNGMVLTDDFAPVENMLAPVARTSQESYPAALIDAANGFLASGELEAAIVNAQLVLRSGIRLAEAREIVGAAYLKQGNVDAAIAELRKSIELDPSRETAFNNLGTALLQKGDANAAIEAWNTAIGIDPGFIEGYKNLAFGLLSKGDLDKAIDTCAIVISSGSYLGEAHEMTGLAQLRQGKLDEALDNLRKAVAADPTRASAFHNLGHALFRKGDLSGAIEAWTKTVNLKPDHAAAYGSLAGAYAQMDDLKTAIGYLRRAVEADPRSVSAHNSLAVALTKKGDMQGAVQEFSAVIAIDPNYPGAEHLLAAAYWKLKDYDHAWRHIKNVQAAGKPVQQDFLEALKRDSGRNE